MNALKPSLVSFLKMDCLSGGSRILGARYWEKRQPLRIAHGSSVPSTFDRSRTVGMGFQYAPLTKLNLYGK